MTREEYLRIFPGYCKKCEGWGLHKGFRPTVHFRECECMQADTCPRCGRENALDLGTCRVCGWNVDDKERGLPGSKVV